MSAWQQILHGFDFSFLAAIPFRAIPALLCITLHELSHGAAARMLGDPTAKNAGRLTLNPLRHLDLFGFVMLIVARVGWAKPVPVDMRRFKKPRRDMAITALAGPAANFLIAALFMLLLGFCLPLYEKSYGPYLLQFLQVTAQLSLGLGIFNLLPIPPLDGSKILFALLPDESYQKLMQYERYGMLLLIALAYTGVTGSLVSRILNRAFDWLLPLASWGANLSMNWFG